MWENIFKAKDHKDQAKKLILWGELEILHVAIY